ncbi:MAG: EAL domain-containing protein, partial [Pseudomonadota bacterium]
AMVHYAGESGATLVAEGVEGTAQFDDLKRRGCHVAQGFAIGRPQSLAETMEWLEKFRIDQDRWRKAI